MNYDWLFSFVVFADKLNLTRAAEELHISQPALYVQIKKLADAVGMPLYARRGRGLVLTPEGVRLAAFGRSIQQQAEEALAELRGESSAGPVVLAAGQGAFLYLLGTAIKRFPKERWPLRLLTLRGPETVAAVRDAKAHLGVAVLQHPPEDLQVAPLRVVGQVAVMQRKHPLATRRRLCMADFDREKLVVAPVGSPHRTMLDQAMRTEEGRLAIGVEATGWELMLEFAKDGMGIALVNDCCPVPRGCVAIEMHGLPKATYYLIARKTSNDGVRKLQELIITTLVAS